MENLLDTIHIKTGWLSPEDKAEAHLIGLTSRMEWFPVVYHLVDKVVLVVFTVLGYYTGMYHLNDTMAFLWLMAAMPVLIVSVIWGINEVWTWVERNMIDGKVYKEVEYESGATITPEPQPEGDYQSFEWTDMPETMPAHDVVVQASYTSGIVDILKKEQDVRIYAPNGKPLKHLQKGVNIIRMSDGTVRNLLVK